jgi:hypothetical protein
MSRAMWLEKLRRITYQSRKGSATTVRRERCSEWNIEQYLLNDAGDKHEARGKIAEARFPSATTRPSFRVLKSNAANRSLESLSGTLNGRDFLI